MSKGAIVHLREGGRASAQTQKRQGKDKPEKKKEAAREAAGEATLFATSKQGKQGANERGNKGE